MPSIFKFGTNKHYGKKLSIVKRGPVKTIIKGVTAASLVLVAAFAVEHNLPRALAAPSLASGFVVHDMPSGQDSLLTDFSFTPDGSYYTVGKNGRVAWVSAGGSAKTLAELPVFSEQDMGLVGVAVAHDYDSSKTIYTVRSFNLNGQNVMRLSAWTVIGAPSTPSSLSNERTVIQIPLNYPVHGMSTVIAAADGTLWVSIGDSSDYKGTDLHALKALDINEGYGKILHIMPNGSGVATNPYYSATQPNSWKSRVYASGFRSPFRMSLDPASGTPVVGDVGAGAYEEVNIVQPGASYGWPCWEGPVHTPAFANVAACEGVGHSEPLYAYHRDTLMGSSVTGGVVYNGESYPDHYKGTYFFGDYTTQRVYNLKYDTTGKLTQSPDPKGFASEQGGPVKFSTAANGDIVYADIMGSKLKRIVYSEGNRAPTVEASISNDPSTRTVTFDASRSYDLDGDTLTYSWSFGDGATATGVKATHTYAAPGTSPVTVTLTVTDSNGAKTSANYTVVPANHTPKLTLSTPPEGTVYKVGDPINLNADAYDEEDGSLTVTWKVNYLHCDAIRCHDHPGPETTGASFNTTFTDHGDDTRLEITASATDKTGAVSQTTYIAQPKLRSLEVASNVPSATLINTIPSSLSKITVGSTVTVDAPLTALDGVSTFERWNDGSTSRSKTFTMPDGDIELTATYLSPIDRRYNNESALRTTLGAPTSLEQGDNILRYRVYEKGRMYWTPRSGAHEIHGGILSNYLAVGGHTALGEPTTDELITRDGIGRYSKFYGTPGTSSGAIYWSPDTGSARIYGAIYQLWISMGAENGKHGYPTSNELAAAKDGGRYNSFQGGRIYWKSSIGARSVHGAIYAKWAEYGHESGFLGFPLTNELATADGSGRYNKFEGGSVYWSSQTGAREVHGAIRARWESLGAEGSFLGYPTSDEFKTSTGARSNFQGGYVTWNSKNGKTYVYRY